MRFILLLLVCFSLEAMSKTAPVFSDVVPNIGVRTLEYQDEKRDRPVVVELWYPTYEQGPFEESNDPIWIHPNEIRDSSLADVVSKYPLILMSHGNRGGRRDRSWLVEYLVPKGFIVASVEHYGNCRRAYDPFLSLRFWDRPLDISFALDQLQQEPFLAESLDRERVGFIGYSLGGMTGLALGGARAKNVKEIALQQCKSAPEMKPEWVEQIDFSESGKSFADPRIKALLLICPATFPYPARAFKEIKATIGLIAAVGDEVLPHREHAFKIIRHLFPMKLKLMRKEISHFSFLNRISESGKEILSADYLGEPPGWDRAAIHREAGMFTVEFFKEHL